MEILKTRKGAICVLIVGIVLSTLLGGHRSLASLCNQTELAFYNGVNNDGYSIEEQLEKRITSAFNLTIIAGRYLSANDDGIVNVLRAKEKLDQSQSISSKFKANRELTENMTILYNALGQIEISDSDETYRNRLYTSFISQGQEISHNDYNAVADEFNNAILGKFPANILSKLTFVQGAETFR